VRSVPIVSWRFAVHPSELRRSLDLVFGIDDIGVVMKHVLQEGIDADFEEFLRRHRPPERRPVTDHEDREHSADPDRREREREGVRRFGTPEQDFRHLLAESMRDDETHVDHNENHECDRPEEVYTSGSLVNVREGVREVRSHRGCLEHTSNNHQR